MAVTNHERVGAWCVSGQITAISKRPQDLRYLATQGLESSLFWFAPCAGPGPGWDVTQA